MSRRRGQLGGLSGLALCGLLSLVLACAQTQSPAPTGPDAEPTAGAPGGDATSDRPPDPIDPDDPLSPSGHSVPTGGPIARHMESGLEGMIIGTVVGGQVAGIYGAAVGAGLFGLYGLITGDVPFDDGRAQPRPGSSRPGTPEGDDALSEEIEDEIAKQSELEREIEEELKRQEELLAAINQEEQQAAAIRKQEEERVAQELNRDPLAAPESPYERDIPESLYEVRKVKTAKGREVHKTLDADRDGRPEIEVVFDQKTGELESRAEDTNYDGKLDTRNTYENGQISGRSEDTNHDGAPDRWVHYERGRGNRLEVDRDFDGKRDGFQTYSGGWLVLEEHDTNGDGKIDRRVEYVEKRRQLEREDSNHDGRFDTTTYYDVREVPTRVERDTKGDGKVDVWEFYEGKDPSQVVMVRKEEDLTADGSADVKSFYKKGKLVRKEVSDPDLLLQ